MASLLGILCFECGNIVQASFYAATADCNNLFVFLVNSDA